MAAWLCAHLMKEGHQVSLLSGELTVEQRAAVIERFRNGKEKVLVTTNVCSRGERGEDGQGFKMKTSSYWPVGVTQTHFSVKGIDVEQVSLVVNFDLPVDLDGNADNETYLHRIGRTGRFGRRGFAVNMVDSKRSMDIIKQIEMHFSMLSLSFSLIMSNGNSSKSNVIFSPFFYRQDNHKAWHQ